MSEQERMDGPELVPDLKLAEFELQLARAMRRVDAPEGFAARVMDRAASPVEVEQKVLVIRPRSGLWRLQAWMGGALAAVLALGMYGAEVLHQRREQAKADQQFAVAMQATNHAIAQTREQLQRAGLKLGE
ncbi:hypothetical protein [Granulicella sp. L46]|jgi:hypothetical protein|uniref:hypothetical protein n=1 Tax=Granulicella sp. L46 TaxID=1641865 RepID=UPI00131B5707|nr:hypothetical protein [Granulicella sp. L46]